MIKNNINFDNQSLHYGLQNTQFLSCFIINRSKENVNKPAILTNHLDKRKFIDKTSFIFFAWTVTNGGLERERVKMESSWSFKSS